MLSRKLTSTAWSFSVPQSSKHAFETKIIRNTHASPMKSRGSKRTLRRSWRALLTLGLLELWYGAAPLNRNCCCYCGGGLGSGVRRRPHNREESRGRLSGAATRRAASLRASQPSRRVGHKGPPIWYIWIFRTARRRGKRHAGPRRDVGRAQKVARAVTAPRAQ